MPDTFSIVRTKLFIPHPRDLTVPRDALYQRIADIVRYPVTLVVAPPGYGKTTLMATCMASLPGSKSWLSLEADDNDPARFFVHLIASLQDTLKGAAEELMAFVRSPQPIQPKAMMSAVSNALVTDTQPVVMVLDDYHHIHEPNIHAAVQYLIEHASPRLHVVLCTRTDPPLPLARWRARNQMLEVRAADLRFNKAETAAFFANVMQMPLAPALVSQLTERTEGWIAALQLAALSMRGHSDLNAFVSHFNGSERYIVDYLMDEVLAQQNPEVVDFLLKTSVLERMCHDLCAALTDNPASQEMLEYLEQANLFVVSLDDDRVWYRYHHLFAHFLRKRLGKSAGKAQHQRAAAWYAAAGYLQEAINHAFEAENPAWAGELIETQFRVLLSQGLINQLVAWFRKLPPALFVHHPDWELSYATCLIYIGSISASQQHLANAAQNLVNAPLEKQPIWAGWVATLHTLLSAYDLNAADTHYWAQQALAQIPQDDAFVLAAIHNALGIVLNNAEDKPQEALEAFRKAAALARQADHVSLLTNSLHHIGTILRTMGRLKESEAIFRDVLAEFANANTITVPLSAIYDGLALTLFEQNQLGEVSAIYSPAMVTFLDSCDLPSVQIAGYFTLATLRAANKDYTSALEINQKASALAQKTNDWFMLRAAQAQRATMLVEAGQPGEAYQWAAHYETTVPLEKRIYDRAYLFDTLMWTGILLHQGRLQELEVVLDPVIATARSTGRRSHETEIIITRALTHDALGRKAAAYADLHEAVRRALPENHQRLFLNAEAYGIAGLLRRFAAEARLTQQEYAFVQNVLGGFVPQHTELPRQPGAEGMAEPLTEREMEVLRLVDAGLTNQEIAERLFIALATTKKHISNIFLKLGVQNRTQALSRAREYNLI